MAALCALRTQYKIDRLTDTSETDSERLNRVQDLHARCHAWLLGTKDSNATVLTEPSSLVAINSGVSLNTRDGISAPTGPSVQDWPSSKDGVPRCSHHYFSPMPVYHYLDACPDKEGRYHARTLRESQVVILRQTGDQSGTTTLADLYLTIIISKLARLRTRSLLGSMQTISVSSRSSHGEVVFLGMAVVFIIVVIPVAALLVVEITEALLVDRTKEATEAGAVLDFEIALCCRAP